MDHVVFSKYTYRFNHLRNRDLVEPKHGASTDLAWEEPKNGAISFSDLLNGVKDLRPTALRGQVPDLLSFESDLETGFVV